MLACFTVWAKNPAIIKPNSVAVAPAKEPKWGRYIPEPPPSLRSSTFPIVPPPPRHGSIVSHQNPYYQSQSDVSFDSQASSSDYYYDGGSEKRLSYNYNDSTYSPTSTTGYSSPYNTYNNHYTNSYSTSTSPYYNSSDNNYPQLTSMLPTLLQMDRTELFNNTPGPSDPKSDYGNPNKTSANRFSGLFPSSTYSPTSPTIQLPLLQPLTSPSHFASSSSSQQQQDNRISWGFSDYQYNPTDTSDIPLPTPHSIDPTLPIPPKSPTTSVPYSPSPSASMLAPNNYTQGRSSGQHNDNHRHSVASELSFGYSLSSNNNPPSRTLANNKDYYPVGSNRNDRYSSPPSSTPAVGDMETRHPSVITVDSLPSAQKPQQYDMHRSSC